MTERGDQLRVLAVDDVPAALDELCRLLRRTPDVGTVTAVADPLGAIKRIQGEEFDVVFLDIAMPGLDGLELGSLLSKLAAPPAIVFVTAYGQHAVSAYGIGAVDYLLKPVRPERLDAALTKARRMAHSPQPAAEAPAATAPTPDESTVLAVESDGRTWYVRREDVRFVEAHGDYVRLYTPSGRHPVRMPISRLEQQWAHAHFLRVHRSYLVALPAVQELRSDSAGSLVAQTDLGGVPVSRRHARPLRDSLFEAAQHGLLERPT